MQNDLFAKKKSKSNVFLTKKVFENAIPFAPNHECHYIQLRNFIYIRLLNKPYENEVNLTGQKTPLKCCQPLEFLTHFKMGLDLFILKICGL